MKNFKTRDKTCPHRFTSFNEMVLNRYKLPPNITYVEIGLGHSPFCVFEFREALLTKSEHVISIGIDNNAECVKNAKRYNKFTHKVCSQTIMGRELDDVSFICGSCDLIPKTTTLIRCMNVFRQAYKERDFEMLLNDLDTKELNCLFFEGSSRSSDAIENHQPNFYVVNVFVLSNGNHTYKETIFGRDVGSNISPMDFQSHLPRIFIEKMHTDEEIAKFMKTWNILWSNIQKQDNDIKWTECGEILKEIFPNLEIHTSFFSYQFQYKKK